MRVAIQLTNIIFIILVHLLNACVDQRLQVISITLDAEFFTATQGCGWEQDEFDKGKNTVVFDDSGSSRCFPDLLSDNIWRI